MKIMKKLGCVGTLGVVLAFSSNSFIFAETPVDYGGSAIWKKADNDNLVHRVNSSVAVNQSYSKNVTSGYKWGQRVYETSSSAATSVSERSVAGYAGHKWGRSNTVEQAGSKWGRS